MTIKVATVHKVLKEAIRLAKSDPDFVYDEQEGRPENSFCGYGGWNIGTTEGRPCIIGQALINLGADREELSHYGNTVVQNHEDFFEDFDIGDDSDVNALDFLKLVQLRQDSGYSWGEALDAAEASE